MPHQAKPGTRQLTGILLVDKPPELTSNRILQQVKRLYAARKAGHTGTLDPMATGMLPICFGAATRVSGLMLEASKRYRVTACFGVATDTGDATGRELERSDSPEPPRAAIEQAVADRARSPGTATRPSSGRRLYEIAREGREVPRKAREIEIHELAIEALAWPVLTLSVLCSKGTYVRTLVTDLAASLGTVAHVTALRRLAVGPFREEEMVSVDRLERAAAQGQGPLDRFLLGIDRALADRPAVTVSEAEGEALRHGRRVVLAPADREASVRVYDSAGTFIGLGELAASGELRPARIFPA